MQVVIYYINYKITKYPVDVLLFPNLVCLCVCQRCCRLSSLASFRFLQRTASCTERVGSSTRRTHEVRSLRESAFDRSRRMRSPSKSQVTTFGHVMTSDLFFENWFAVNYPQMSTTNTVCLCAMPWRYARLHHTCMRTSDDLSLN